MRRRLMRACLTPLRLRDYRLLWSGAMLSQLGDGATWTALTWLALVHGNAAALGVLGICYTAPVIAGGFLVGPLLDRFDRRAVLVADCVLRGVAVASIPAVAAFGPVRLWQLYLVAAVYGLLKIVPLGAVPAMLPDLVPQRALAAASALESVSLGVGRILGPAVGGLLIPLVGGASVLLLDAASYLAFGLAVLAVRVPRGGPGPAHPVRSAPPGGWRPVVALLRGDGVLLAITVGFGLFNLAMGMLMVLEPWFAHDRFPGGAHTLGLILALSGGANLAGSLAAGAVPPSDRQMLRIGVLQAVAGASLLLLLAGDLPVVLIGLVLCNVLSTPMTVSSQVLRLSRIPAGLRGRTLTLMRTVMNATTPLGAATAGPLLAAGAHQAVIVLMTLAAALPGLWLVRAYRTTSFGAELGLVPTPPATPVRSARDAHHV
ncbi:MFS transporter [Streptomyces sp. NBC_01799]|uniref:MFS transporter n=1 Tax=Streptomyces sp. NBC_01800 TaxID=2975945 RepID=UPI002DDBD1BB|nr:MFS transporter [Streptomyces sp. NBC_01800]WSA68262.1 MFS transporter [Streptomyces sp. NBC_01800]WSA76867.1 MFS transporter [Streptomyces sp. NBC_01799]